MKKYAIGIDIGGTRTKVGLVDLEEGSVIDLSLTPTEKNDARLFLTNLHNQYLALAEKSCIEPVQIAGIGIGAPGFVYEDGSVDSTYGFLPFMDQHFHLKEELERKRIDKSFFVPAQEIRDNKYDLSINRYKEVVYEEKSYEKPQVIIDQIKALDQERNELMKELSKLLKLN